ncbi:MAG: hypothetical protein KC733_04645 [Candidatus Omnitrophica bacterium]|nr:hypothetical protein [Candidatus Omnitrophota bacterium]
MKTPCIDQVHNAISAENQFNLYTMEGYLENLKAHTLQIQETIALDTPHDLTKNKD